MRASASPSASGVPSNRPPFAAPPLASARDAEWESDPRFLSMAESHERFLLQQRQQQQPSSLYPRGQLLGDGDGDDSANADTFGSMASWEHSAAQHVSQQQRLSPAYLSASSSLSSARSHVLVDDDGGDEVSMDVLLAGMAGIAAGREADALSRGVPLSQLHGQQQYAYEAARGEEDEAQYYSSQQPYLSGAEEQLDSSMLDSVLKALEEEEEELDDSYTQQQQQQQQQQPVAGVLSLDDLERSLRTSALGEQKSAEEQSAVSHNRTFANAPLRSRTPHPHTRTLLSLKRSPRTSAATAHP